MPKVTRSQLYGPTYGTMTQPVRTNLPYFGDQPGARQLLTNYPDSWELEQNGPADWCDDISDNGNPPAWWLGVAPEGNYPIGPHGPWRHGSWGRAVVVRATELICDPLVSDPFKVVRTGAINVPGSSEQLDSRRWITDPQLLRPDDRVGESSIPHNERLARSTFWREWVREALWYGMGFISTRLDAQGQPVAGSMRLYPRDTVTWSEPDQWGRGGRWYIGDPQQDWWYDATSGYFRGVGGGRQLVILRNPHSPVDAHGHTFGVFDLNPAAFRTALMVDQYLAQTFRAGVPNGYLKVTQPNITQPQANELKQRWMDAHGRRRSIAVLNQSTEFVPLTWSPVDANVQEMKRLAIADIAFAFGMAPEVLGVSLGMSGTYSNIRDWWRLHRDFALSPWVDQIGGVLSAYAPAGTNIIVNLDAHTRPDLSDRVDIFARGQAAGLDPAALAQQLDLPWNGGADDADA